MSERLDFSLTQLRYFVAAAETGNISLAAERLHASQSALSSAILRLEKQLGCQLLLRHHAKGIALTPNGRRLLGEARTLLRQARDLKAHSQALQDEIVGELHVACYFPLAPYLIPLILSRLRESYPGLLVRVHEVEFYPLDELLRDGICELGLTAFAEGSEEFDYTRMAALDMHALVSHDHPLVDAGPVGMADLVTEPFVMLDLPYARRYYEGLFARALLPMPEVISTTSLETMRGLVGVGMGFALLHHRTDEIAALCGARLATLELTDDVDRLIVGTVAMAGLEPSERAVAFMAAARDAMREVYPPGAVL